MRTYVAVDGGMSDNPRPVTYGAGYEAFLPARVDAPRPSTAAVAGKHCEQGDILVRDAHLPADVAVGDVLATPVHGGLRRFDGVELQPGAPARSGLRRRRSSPGRGAAATLDVDDLVRAWRVTSSSLRED